MIIDKIFCRIFYGMCCCNVKTRAMKIKIHRLKEKKESNVQTKSSKSNTEY